MANIKAIEGKVVVITGASSGAGRAIANEFARCRANLVLGARREDALSEVAEECRALGGSALVVKSDTREMEDMVRLAQEAVSVHGRIDIWVNNAGVLAAGNFDEVPAEVNENVIRTNLLGYIHGAQAVLPYFKEQGSGMIVNNISVGGWFPTPYMSAYSASKFGLKGFFESLKGEMKEYPDIHICDLYPGFLDTPGIQHAANYTGKVLRPAPPVYDPRKLARVVVSLVDHPKSRVIIGASSGFLGFAHYIFPALSRNITAYVIRKYLKSADPIQETSGNVLHTVDYGNSIDGGWRTTGMKPKVKLGALLMAGLAIGMLWAGKK